MARWRLTQSHYLEIESLDDQPVEWEYKEIDQNTGRSRSKRFNVPFLLDILDVKGCWNDQSGIIVSNGNNPGPRDYIFNGDPTPEMEPLDEEAQQITDACAANWVHPIDSLPGQGYTQSLLAGLEKQLSAIALSTKPVAISENSVSKEDFEELKAQIKALMAKNAELEGAKLEAVPEQSDALTTQLSMLDPKPKPSTGLRRA